MVHCCTDALPGADGDCGRPAVALRWLTKTSRRAGRPVRGRRARGARPCVLLYQLARHPSPASRQQRAARAALPARTLMPFCAMA
jgi:hypothetical protein